MKGVLITIVSCLLLTSCVDRRLRMSTSESITNHADGFIHGEKNYRFTGGAESQAPSVAIEHKLIKNGSIEFEVSDVEATKKSVIQLTADFGGYISSENQNNYATAPRYEQTVRIPADKLDEFISKIEALARNVDAKNISTQDVTEEFIDVETRLKTKKELESRYLELLKQAKTVKDLIEVETQLANVRGEIESMEGRLKYLTNQVSFSTLNVVYYKHVSGNNGFGYRFSRTFGEGWDAFLDFVIGLFAAWPFVIMLVLAIWLGRRWWRNRKLKTS